MNTFAFSKQQAAESTTIFRGRQFFAIFSDSEFLQNTENVEMILSRAYELRQNLKAMNGEALIVKDMYHAKNSPLVIKHTGGPNVKVADYEFTINRLTGLTAAYAFQNRHRFPVLQACDATVLGLKWNHEDEEQSRLYLSSVSGAEYFCDQFYYWPLICALRKLHIGKMPLKQVMKIANIKNNEEVRAAHALMKDFENVKRLWCYFPKSSVEEMIVLFQTAPPELKRLFIIKKY